MSLPIIQTFASGPYKTNAYVVACPQTHRAAIIDPSPKSSEAIVTYVRDHNLVVDKILLTHSHWDHIADVSILKRVYAVPVAVHPADAANLQKPGSDGLRFPGSIEPVEPDLFLQDNELIHIGTLTFQVIHTPGHSPGGVCFYDKEHGILFSGDTLFHGTIGNISSPTAQPEQIWTSLAKLAQLPSTTAIYPGHGPSSTIGTENWLPDAKRLFS